MADPEGVEVLAERAGNAHADGELQDASQLLQELTKQGRDQDPKVLHNIAVTEYLAGNACEPRKLLAVLETLKQRLDDARADSEMGDGMDASVGDADASLIYYNTAVLLYQLKQYARCRALLEEMFSNIEPIDEFLAFKVCFLLLDVHLLQRQPEKAAEVLAFLERSYATLTKADHKVEGSQNGVGEGGEAAGSACDVKAGTAIAGGDWPNKRSTRRPPTDITADEVRAALNLYKAKLALMSKASKSSKREIKSTLNACAQNTTGLFLKSNLEYLRQNYRKAIKLLSNSCMKSDRDPNVAALYFNNMGCIHHCMRKHAAASFYFTRALKENALLQLCSEDGLTLPSFSCDRGCEIEYNRGLQYLFSARTDQAFGSFQTALLLLHRQPRIWLRIGETCVAAHLQQQQAGPRVPMATPVGLGRARRLLVGGNREPQEPCDDASEEGAAADATAAAAEAPTAPAPTASTSGGGAPTLSLGYGVQSLRNALLLAQTQLEGGTSDFQALKLANEQGTLTSTEEYALHLHTVERLALLQLSFCALVQADNTQALSWAERLLDSAGCPNNIKVYAHLYACEALCHLSRSVEALEQLAYALQLGDSLGAVISSSGCESTSADGDIDSVRNPYSSIDRDLAQWGTPSSRAVLYTNLAAVHVLQGDLKQASQCTQRALSLQPNSQKARLCLVYLELRAGNPTSAVDILQRQRLPPSYS